MVALLRDIVTHGPCGIHRTALLHDGGCKQNMPDGMDCKMMLGRAKRAAVMIAQAAERMGIAEGIETAISAQQIFEIPVWSVGSGHGIAQFPVLPGIRHLTIFADYDEAGLRAAEECYWRYKNAGVPIEVRHPSTLGTDWNDYLREGA
jgi:hypothetical protein